MDVKNKNQEAIEAYLKYKQRSNRSRREEGITQGTLHNKRNYLEVLSQSLKNKPFKQATEEDILDHLDGYKQSSKNSQITVFRDFYRWLYKLEPEDRLPDCIRKIKPRSFDKDPVKAAEEVVSDEEYTMLLENASKPIHRAIIEALYVTGCRVDEIQSALVGDVVFDGTYTRVLVRESKTKTREVIYPGRAEHLLKWSETLCPYVGEKGMPLFAVKRGDKRVNKGYAWEFLNDLTRRIGMRHLKNHQFRHTRASRMLADGVPETHIKTLLGWSKDSQMLRVYDHNGIHQVEDHFNKRSTNVKPTYPLLQKQKEELEQQHAKKIADLEAKYERLMKLVNLDGQFDKLK